MPANARSTKSQRTKIHKRLGAIKKSHSVDPGSASGTLKVALTWAGPVS